MLAFKQLVAFSCLAGAVFARGNGDENPKTPTCSTKTADMVAPNTEKQLVCDYDGLAGEFGPGIVRYRCHPENSKEVFAEFMVKKTDPNKPEQIQYMGWTADNNKILTYLAEGNRRYFWAEPNADTCRVDETVSKQLGTFIPTNIFVNDMLQLPKHASKE